MYVNWDLTRDLYDEENFKKDFYYAKVKRSKAKKMDVRVCIKESIVSETIPLFELLLKYLNQLNPNPKYIVDKVVVFSLAGHFEKETIPEYQGLLDYFNPLGIKVCILDIAHNQCNEYQLILEANRVILPICERVKKWKASPLEKMMVLYAYVGLFPYKDNKREKMATREWARFVLHGYGVCLGFIDVFMRMMEFVFEEKTNYCDIVSFDVQGDDWGVLHAAGTVRVVDRKYGINGIYHIDPTWDHGEKLDNGIGYFMLPISEIANFQVKMTPYTPFEWQYYYAGIEDVESYFPDRISTFCRRLYRDSNKDFFHKLDKLIKNSKPLSNEIYLSLFERLGEFYKLDDPKAFAKRKLENSLEYINEYR